MSEDSQLLSKISRLAGQINRQRDKASPAVQPSRQLAGTPRQLGTPGIHKSGQSKLIKASSSSHSIAPDPSKHVKPLDPQKQTQTTTGRVHRLEHDGLQYIVTEEGGMLVRDFNFGDPSQETPRLAKIHGVFFENKRGHLFRRDATRCFPLLFSFVQGLPARSTKPCNRFTATGKCPRGSECFGIHDPSKVAICRDFLKAGHCSRGGRCDLSHNPTYERVPSCVHFLRGTCSKDDCLYPHVATDESAPVCSAFARHGYCEKGIKCPEKHILECPEYSNTGKCLAPKCRLPHIDRAAKLRQRDLTTKPMGQYDSGSLPTTDHSDDAFDELMPRTRVLHGLPPSSDLDADFIPFDEY